VRPRHRGGRALQAKVDAQSTILQHVVERLGIDHREMLTELIGVEDAPEHAIKEHQENVRRSISVPRCN
jgi:hypothetical protein